MGSKSGSFPSPTTVKRVGSETVFTGGFFAWISMVYCPPGRPSGTRQECPHAPPHP